MARGRRKYTPEFRAEAVRLVRENGMTITQVAADLGVAKSSIVNWLRVTEAGERPGALNDEERAELRRLRRENDILRQERDILKKATVFFARDSS